MSKSYSLFLYGCLSFAAGFPVYAETQQTSSDKIIYEKEIDLNQDRKKDKLSKKTKKESGT